MDIKRRRDKIRAARSEASGVPVPNEQVAETPGYIAPKEFQRVISIYLGLSAKRPAGMGVEPIPSFEIEAYARRHDLQLTLFEQELLDKIDAAFRSGTNKALKQDQQSREKHAALKKGGASHGSKHRKRNRVPG